MATPAPKWSVDNIVYIQASAKVGFLEAYKVSGIHRIRGRWTYSIDIMQKPPSEPSIGDMIDIKQERVMYFDENELIDFHEALLLVKNGLDSKRNKIQQMLDKYFPTGTNA